MFYNTLKYLRFLPTRIEESDPLLFLPTDKIGAGFKRLFECTLPDFGRTIVNSIII